MTALLLASEKGHISVVKFLLGRGANTGHANTVNLIVACWMGQSTDEIHERQEHYFNNLLFVFSQLLSTTY